MGQSLQIEAKPYKLTNQVQHYAWGARGSKALIPSLLGIAAEDDKTYAELWIGAHATASSVLCVEGKPWWLDRAIQEAPEQILGREVNREFSGSLPFLFKVLCAAEALSIQAHPNKIQAAELHSRDPEHYPDANHKPELAVALSGLTALVGFRPTRDIRRALMDYHEIASYIGADAVGDFNAGLGTGRDDESSLVAALMTTLIRRSKEEPERLGRAIRDLEDRLGSESKRLTASEQLFLDLASLYPGADVGRFLVFLLNRVHLERGQGIFIDAGIPHAYLQGDIIECMANSDNVVRIGLTPKFKDAEALIEVLSYEPRPVTVLGAEGDQAEVLYAGAPREFRVSRLLLEKGAKRDLSRYGPRILFVFEGTVHVLWEQQDGRMKMSCERGETLLIPAVLATARLQAKSDCELFWVEVPR